MKPQASHAMHVGQQRAFKRRIHVCIESLLSLINQLFYVSFSPFNRLMKMSLSKELNRWLVVGIALHKTVAPVLRCFVEQEVTKLYNHYDSIFNLKTLQFKQVSAHPELKSLSFRNTNGNHKESDKKKYTYHIYSPLDLAKLYLIPDFAKRISGFDETLDPSAILVLLGSKVSLLTEVHHASPSHAALIQRLADDVRENVRNVWGHYDSTKWTETFFSDCFDRLEKLVCSLGLKDGGKTTLDELDEYKTKGKHRFNVI